MRFGLALAATSLGLLATGPLTAPSVASAPASVSAKARACKVGQVPVTIGKKTTCKPLGKAIPTPKAIDIRLAHLQEVLKQDVKKLVKGKKRKRLRTLQSGFGAAGKRAQKKLLKVLPKALAFIDRKGGARSSSAPPALAVASAGCQPGPAGPTGQTGGASMGTLGDNGGYVDASVGGGFRVRVTFVSCKGANNFRLPQCPTANGSVEGKATGDFLATVEVWDGDQLVSRNSSTFEDKAKTHGEVGPDAKLKSIDVEHTQEVFIVASGGIVIRGGVTRKVRIAMPGGKYDPAAASVRFYGDSIAANSGADAFASTAASALNAYQAAEPRWSTFKAPYCAEAVFAPAADSLKLRQSQTGQVSMYAQASDGGRATGARWTLAGAENADFIPTSSGDPAPSISYTVVASPQGDQVRVVVKFTSTAGVGEKSWTQPIELTGINEISGTYTQVTEQNGGVFTVAGNATYERFTPPFLSPVEGSFKLVSGLYTFTASGKASIATLLCSMKGSGQFAVHKESQFTVFSETFDGKPPFSYGFEVSSENQPSLPMIDIEFYGCSPPADELEGEIIEYPATFAIVADGIQTSPDGITYAGSFEESFTNYRFANSWNFIGKE